MNRYFFDMFEGDLLILDEEGMDLATLDAVQREAGMTLADLARDEVARDSSYDLAHNLAVQVRDQDGPVMRATFLFEIKRVH